jgi:glucosyl-dolichyl phosphate glucuronosyltransferase
MSVRSFRPTIIIPTKDRAQILAQLLDSLEQLEALERIFPEIIVADNDSQDNTYEHVNSKARCFPTTIRALKVRRPGKSAAINDAVREAAGNVLAFLDDDVVVDKTWLTSIEEFFQVGKYHVGQGIIRLQSPARDDPEIQTLVQRYRTIPKLEHNPNLKEVRSLNGSNFFVSREVFDRIGGFDERLGPGASGTSEDVEFAHRLARSGIGIGYVSKAVVYHRVDRRRLTDEYFKEAHWRQGKSRFLIRNRGAAEIIFNLIRACGEYVYYTVIRKERNRYRSKGRIYHYLGMIDAKHNNADHLEER